MCSPLQGLVADEKDSSVHGQVRMDVGAYAQYDGRVAVFVSVVWVESRARTRQAGNEYQKRCCLRHAVSN